PSAIAHPGHPGRAPADRAGGAHAQESVAEREAGFDGALGQDVVTFVAQEPARISRRFQRFMHPGRSPSNCISWDVSSSAADRPNRQRMFASQLNFFRFMADPETFSLTQ